MRVLLDENVPHRLRLLIPGHEVYTVGFQGWTSLTNGALIAAAEKDSFDVIVTADRELQHQQNITSRRLSFVALPTNRLAVLLEIIPEIVSAIEAARPGTFVPVDLPERLR